MGPHLRLLGVCAIVSVAGCGLGGGGIEFYGVDETEPGGLVVELRACTRDDVTATVVETPDEVRIDDVSATVFSGDDCSGALTAELDAALGERDLVVDGARWVPFPGTWCASGRSSRPTFRPGSSTVPAGSWGSPGAAALAEGAWPVRRSGPTLLARDDGSAISVPRVDRPGTVTPRASRART
jgi:hypothetical protein